MSALSRPLPAFLRPVQRSRAAQQAIDGCDVARARHLLGVAARLVAQFGEEMLPVFEAMEAELARVEARRSGRASALNRALALAGGD